MTSWKIKILLLAFVVPLSICTHALTTKYYKLVKKVENNVSSTNVKGGQFITFLSDICYESDNHGVGVNHGKLTKNTNYSNSEYIIYQGDAYWGSNTTFKFKADKSQLIVITKNEDVYYYKCQEAPANQLTCSLIRQKNQPSSNSSGDGGVVMNTPAINGGMNMGGTISNPSSGNTNTPSASSSSPQKRWRNVTRTETCPSCHGTGKCWTCNGKGYNSYGTGIVNCSNCNNGRCRKCGGSGTITKTEQVYE